jgi:serine/threonine protein kinase/TPR repeat protein
MPAAERYQQYELLRREDGSLWELGRGAMGITYKAYDTNLRFAVALKVINSAYLESDTARQRFLREARSAAGLRHPNVASVFNLGIDQGSYFYVMEFIDGETVEALVKRKGALEPVEALNIVLQVARALAVAAKQQLVHRDLKPSNLMLVDQEGETVVKVIDFGLAKVTKDDADDSGTLTVAGFVGTPHFASPEQVEEGEVDIRSDIYSLGATLYFVLTGQAPFSGSVGQIMSQHLYKPLPMEPLSRLPACVASLVQRMTEKDRNARPQTPQELQKAILACLDEIRTSSGTSPQIAGDAANAFETLDLTIGSSQPLAVGVTLLQTYKLVEELTESPNGRNFLAEDLVHRRRVSILVLSPEFLADAPSLTALREAVLQLRKAPHPMLREIYALETLSDRSFLVEEYVAGTTLLDLLRTRGELSAPEVIRLVKLLAPVVDHATSHGLQHIEITLSGIHLVERISSRSGLQSEVLRRPLTAWEPLNAKVDSIDFTFSPARLGTWAGMATRIQGTEDEGRRGSYVRSLSLLSYELLGGSRSRLDATGQYTPVATLTQEGNAVLRRGLVDEYKSASELANYLAATAGAARSPSPAAASTERSVTEAGQLAPPPVIPTDRAIKPKFKVPPWLLIVVVSLILLAGIGVYLMSNWAGQKPEIAALSVRTDPEGAIIRLDGKSPQVPPNTFTHVPFGAHQLSASLDSYEPVTQNIEVRPGMAPDIHLQLKPIQEIAALSVRTDPEGAIIRLDGKPPQVPPNTFTHVPLGAHQLSASLDSYEPVTQNIEVRPGMAPDIHLQLKPSQEIAALSVQTEPAGASVLLDGRLPQAAPNTFTHVPFGSHQLSATLNDYEPVTQNIQVRKGMDPQIRLQLKPIQEIAALSIQTEPAAASILLDGKPPQILPNTFTHVAFGTHRVSATLEDYEPIKQDIDVRKGMRPQIQLKLKPIQEIAALSVQTEPAGASILLDGKPPQILPNTFTHVPFGTHQLSAALEDYEPMKQDIDVRRGMKPQIQLKLKPIQEIAALSVQTEPEGASILLDGKPPQILPNTFTHVPFGTHQVSAALDDYEPMKQDIDVRRGMKPQIQLKLKPIQEIAALSIQTEPVGATILLDGKPPQVPPNKFTRVPYGSHQLSATLENFESITQDIQVRRGMNPEILLRLKEIQEIAALSIQTEPSGASVLLDGMPPQVAPATFVHVPFGPHHVSVSQDNYEPLQQEIQVRKGMSRIHLQLKQLQEIAALTIKTTPPEASILLDGKPPESSPNVFTHVPFGSHQLSATLDTYEPVKQDIDVYAGMSPEIQLQLKPIQDNGNQTLEVLLRDAQLGDSNSMIKLGLRYLKKGTPTDDAEGFKWLSQAYNPPNNNPKAGAYLGDCYLSGKGTRQDLQKADEIIMPLANQNVVPAMTLAGRILQYKAEVKRSEALRSTSPQLQKQLVAQANDLDRRARQWWERAEKDDWNAAAHLGKCYEEGWGGVPRSEEQAEKRYTAGVSHGNALSMFFYGLLIEKKPGRHSEAQSLISRAATAGIPSAIKWCKENSVAYGDRKSDEDR